VGGGAAGARGRDLGLEVFPRRQESAEIALRQLQITAASGSSMAATSFAVMSSWRSPAGCSQRPWTAP
jgi:hypothetical protein